MDSAKHFRDDKFRFEFIGAHKGMEPQLTKGTWHIEQDGDLEYEVVSESGRVVAFLEALGPGDLERVQTNAQCIKLVPHMIRAIYTAMRALKGNLPDDETPESVAQHLSDLLRECYASPKPRDTIG